jgi:hypothetical protein
MRAVGSGLRGSSHSRVLVLLLLVAAAACSRQASPAAADFRECDPKALASPAQLQWQRAERARDQLAQALLAELSQAMAQGAEHAVAVCSERAPVLAGAVSAAEGVLISRTSLRLRNPRNAAPAWAQARLAAGVGEPACFLGVDGQLAAMFPIRIAGACLQCHGPVESLGEPLRAALAGRYPEDRATGYADGDLRGWFVVEVPR